MMRALAEKAYEFDEPFVLGDTNYQSTFTSYGDEETAGDVIALIGELGATALAAAQRPGLVSSLVLVGPFVRNGKTSAMRRLLLRVAMAPPWADVSRKSHLPKLYAGRRSADFGEYRNQVVASLRRPGYARAFSCTTRTSHDAEARLADVTAPVLVVMASRTPTSLTRGLRMTGSRRPARTSRHGARGRALPAVATARHHYQRRPALPGIGQGPCLGQRSSSPAQHRPAGRSGGARLVAGQAPGAGPGPGLARAHRRGPAAGLRPEIRRQLPAHPPWPARPAGGRT
jgi:hypothetical protein